MGPEPRVSSSSWVSSRPVSTCATYGGENAPANGGDWNTCVLDALNKAFLAHPRIPSGTNITRQWVAMHTGDLSVLEYGTPLVSKIHSTSGWDG